jgi:hypothetical protein
MKTHRNPRPRLSKRPSHDNFDPGTAAAPDMAHDGTLHVLRDNIARADALLTAVEGLIERSWDEEDDEDEDGDNLARRRNHVAYLIEGARLAVRGAIYAGNDLDLRRRGP